MTSIFVAKLDFNTTDEQLKSLFEEYGRVNRVTIAKDRETGKPRGFAFVEMADEQEADAAIEALDNSSVNGRQIAVKKADDRSNNKPAGDRPQRTDYNNRPPRTGGQEGGGFRNDYKKPDTNEYKKLDDRPTRPSFNPDEVNPLKVERKKETKSTPKASDAPKKNKMEAYRKSGKDNQYLNDDDLSDEELDLFGRYDEEDEDDDYRKYLVNNDEDSDEDYDDDEEWDDDDED